MEIIAQWLDDLDDLVFAAMLLLGRLWRPSLGVGLGSAGALVAVQTANALGTWLPTLVATALGGLAVWVAEPVAFEKSPSNVTLTAPLSHDA